MDAIRYKSRTAYSHHLPNELCVCEHRMDGAGEQTMIIISYGRCAVTTWYVRVVVISHEIIHHTHSQHAATTDIIIVAIQLKLPERRNALRTRIYDRRSIEILLNIQYDCSLPSIGHRSYTLREILLSILFATKTWFFLDIPLTLAQQRTFTLSPALALFLSVEFEPFYSLLVSALLRYTRSTTTNDALMFKICIKKKPDRQSTARRVKVRRKTRRKTNCEFMPSTSYRSIQLRQYTK